MSKREPGEGVCVPFFKVELGIIVFAFLISRVGKVVHLTFLSQVMV